LKNSRISKLRPYKRRLIENFLSLSFLQGANYILPLITLPYLVRVLGPDKFGLVAFAQSFAQYFIIITDYGFNLSATREISVNRHDQQKVAAIFNAVLIIKLFLLIFGFAIFALIIFTFSRFQNEWLVFLLTYGVVVGNVLFPVWFFQGIEHMKYITLLNIVSKLIFTLAIFLFIRQASHYVYVPLLSSIGYITAGVLGQWIAHKRFQIRYFFPSLKFILERLKESTQFFLSRVSLSIYTSSNTLVLGLFTSNQTVGYYSAAEKLYIALQGAYHPLVNVLYPYISKEKNVALFKKLFKRAIIFHTFVALTIFMLSAQIVQLLYGSGMEVSGHVLKIFAVVSVVVIPSILLGYPFLAAMGHPKYANSSVILGSLFHLTGLVFFAITGTVNIYRVAGLVFITEFMVLSIRVWASIKKKVWEVA